jgi:hypothetical protein
LRRLACRNRLQPRNWRSECEAQTCAAAVSEM